MNFHTRLLLLAIWTLMVSLSACESVIQVDIEEAAPRIVIEADVYNGTGPHKVRLTKSVGIDSAYVYPDVEGAFVMIADNEGHRDTLVEVKPGHYETNSLIGTPGDTYFLTVIAENTTYSATSTMPQPVLLDSVYNLTAAVFGGIRHPIVVELTDPAHVKNQYRFISFVNGYRKGGSNVESDANFDGQHAQFFLPGLGANVLVGDTLSLHMQCIDAAVFRYFDSFRSSATGPGSSSAPSNPYTNIVGGALGYFNACTRDLKTVIIQ